MVFVSYKFTTTLLNFGNMLLKNYGPDSARKRKTGACSASGITKIFA